MNTAAGQTDHRALLASVGDRLVRRVAFDDGRHADALFAILNERKPRGQGWSHEEWKALLDELDKSEQTVAEFLAAEHARPKSCP